MSKFRDFILIIVGLAFITLSLFLFLKNPAHPKAIPLGTRIEKINFPDVTVTAEVSDTEESRELGLSSRKNLSENTGMLFVFDTPAQYGFWMKEMLFPIDIVGLDEEKNVVWLEKNMEPGSYPQTFAPKTPVKYVLELPSGFIDLHKVYMGLKLSFEP